MKQNTIILWILGFVMVAGGLYLAISTITPPGYQKAAGTILDPSSGATGPKYQRTISFVAKDGKTYTTSDRSYTNAPQVSSEVTVAYHPDNPKESMRVVSDSGRSMLWGIIVALMGGVFVYLGFHKNKDLGGTKTVVKR